MTMDKDKRTYETTDMNPRYGLYFAIALTVSAVVLHVALLLLFRFLVYRQTISTYTPTRLETKHEVPAEPQIQISPGLDYNTFLERQMDQLGSYAWVDRPGATARIPIERAMDIIAESGLPGQRVGDQ